MNVSFNLSICKAATAQPLTATLTSQVPIGSPKSSMAAFDKEVDLLELFGSFIVVRFALNPRSLGTIESRTSIRELLPLFSIGDTLPPKEIESWLANQTLYSLILYPPPPPPPLSSHLPIQVEAPKRLYLSLSSSCKEYCDNTSTSADYLE